MGNRKRREKDRVDSELSPSHELPAKAYRQPPLLTEEGKEECPVPLARTTAGAWYLFPSATRHLQLANKTPIAV